MRTGDLRRSWRRLRAAGAWAGLGDGMVTVALPLLAADTTHDPVPVAAVVAALHLPWVAVALAGPLVTVRADRRTVIGGLDTLRTMAFAWLGLQALVGSVDIVSIAAVAIVAGTAVALVDDAEQETAVAAAGGRWAGQPGDPGAAGGRLAVPAVVSDGFLGVPAGALLFAVVPGAPFLVAAGTYTVAALLALTVLHAPGAVTGALPAGTPRPGVVARMAASPTVLGGAALAGGVTLTGSAVAGPLVLIGLDELGLHAAGIGVLLTAMAGGSLAGGVVAADVGGRVGVVPALTGALLAAAAAYAAAGLLDGSLAVGGALTAASLASMAAMVLARLHRPSDPVAARAFHAVSWAAIPAGALAGGLVAELWGLRAPLLGAAGGLALLVPLAPVCTRLRPASGAGTRGATFAKIC